MSKLAAEGAIFDLVRRGLPAVVLRPAHVYGPFGKTFINNPLSHLTRGKLVLVDPDQTPSNTIHVDNVAQAVVHALIADEAKVLGQVFTLGSEDNLSWAGFYGFFADALGLSLRRISADEYRKGQMPTRRWNPFYYVTSWFRGAREILGSSEFRSLGRKCVQTDPYGRLPRWLLDRFPRMRRLFGLDGMPIYSPPAAAALEQDLTMSFLPGKVSIEKAIQSLGYKPVFNRERALELTLAWLQQSRVIGIS
jgi:nucleoside-diphosphate-sugar epimerase